ncbi:MAG: hypothetical protein E7348_01540 [Clostridiales bacterium]|nr:hypothetical protein [Clostridiales bacterium]
MKKILTKLICTMLVICMLCSSLLACSNNNWSGSTISLAPSKAGSLVENGGFIAETEKYIYFINGMADSNSDNTLGTPVKGALLVAEKSNLSKTEIVVPKLFVASNSSAGLFIDGEYVYYGTPSTEKNSQGEIASDELVFARTKLDGSGQTDTFFTVDNIGIEYRIVKGNGAVCIYYYDTENSAIMCYDTGDNKAYEVIKTDGEQENYYSLDKYVFLDADGSNGIIAVLSATVYTDKYDQELAEKNPTYTRPTANYNSIYAIKAGEKQITLVADGKGQGEGDVRIDDKTFAITLVNDEYLFYKETLATNLSKTYAVKVADLLGFANATKTEIVNDTYVAKTNIIEDLDEVYVLGDTKLYKTTLTEKDGIIKEPIMAKDSIGTLLFKEGDFVYYYNTANQIARVSVNAGDEDFGKAVRVSEDVVATTWFNPEIKDNKIFYCDNTAIGASYIKYMDLGAKVVADEEDDTILYLEGSAGLLAQISDADKASIVTAKINALNGKLPEGGLTGTDEDQDFKTALSQAETEYNALDEDVKKLVSEDVSALIGKYNKAIEIVKLYMKLDGIQYCHSKEQAEGFKDEYEENKSAFETFKNAEDRDSIDEMINNNVKALYTSAYKYFSK